MVREYDDEEKFRFPVSIPRPVGPGIVDDRPDVKLPKGSIDDTELYVGIPQPIKSDDDYMEHQFPASVEPAEDTILFVDRITGTCGRCGETLVHPLPSSCTNCGVNFTHSASTMFGGDDREDRSIIIQLSGLPYAGRRLPTSSR